MGSLARRIQRSINSSRNKYLYGVGSMGLLNRYETASGGGEPGVDTGFGFVALFRLDKLPGANAEVFARIDAVGTAGWRLFISSSNGLTGRFYSAAGGAIAQSGYVFTSSDVGRVFLVIGQNAGNSSRLWCSKLTSPEVAIVGYKVASVATTIATDNGGLNPNSATTVLGVANFRGIPTAGQLNTFYDTVRAMGDLPKTGITPVYGTHQFSATNYWQTAASQGVRGSNTGFSAWWVGSWYTVPATTQALLSASSNGGDGWQCFVTSAGTLTFSIRSGGVTYSASMASAVTALSAHLIHAIHCIYDGTTARLYLDGVEVGSVAVPATLNIAAAGFAIGNRGDQQTPASSFHAFGAAGTDSAALTAGEVLANATASRLSGRVESVVGKTEHLWDIHLDQVADPTRAPTQVLDRVGVHHLVWQGTDVHLDANSIRGIGPYGVGDGFQSAAAGGIQGATGGFHVVIDLWLTKVPSTSPAEMIMNCCNAGGTTGWYMQCTTSGLIRWVNCPSNISPTYQLTGADLNKRLRFLIHRTSGGLMQFWLNGVQIGADTGVVTFTANAATVAMTIGQFYGAQPFPSGYVEAVTGGNTALTPAEITSIFADLTVAPPVVATKTLKRWLFESDIASAGGLLPASSVERVSGGDSLTRMGIGWSVVAAGMTLTHRWSVREALQSVANPNGRLTYGARGFTGAGNYFHTAAGLTGSAAGFVVGVKIRFDTLPVAADGRFFGKGDGSTMGWRLCCINGGLFLNYYGAAGAAAEKNSPTYTVTAADLGRPIFALFMADGSTLRTFVGKEVGVGVAYVGYNTPSQPQYIGRDASGTNNAGSMTFFGAVTGHTTLTPTQIATWFAACEAAGEIQAFPGAEHLYNLTLDTAGSSIPAVLTDRIGSDHLTRFNIAVQTDANSIRAVGPYAAADSWLTVLGGGIQGVTGGFHVVLDVWLTKIPLSETLIHCTPVALDKGWYLNTGATGRISFVHAPSTVTPNPGYLLSAGDLNKRLRFLMHRTGAGLMQLWLNGVQIGPDTAATFVANVSNVMGLGQLYTGSSGPFTSGYIEACEGGNFALTAGEITAIFADLTTLPPVVAGKTTKRWIFEQDIAAAGGVLPSRSVERVSGGDDLARTGAPLELAIDVAKGPTSPVQLADTITGVSTDALLRIGQPDARVIDPGVDGRRTLGAQSGGVATYLSTTGIAGSAAGFSVTVAFTLSATGVAQHLIGRSGYASAGWLVYVKSNGLIVFAVHNGTLFVESATLLMAAAYLNRPVVVTAVHTGAALRLYVDGVQVGADVAIGAFAVYSGPTTILGTPVGGVGAPSVAVYAVSWADTPLSLASVQTLYREFSAKSRLPIIAGITTHHYEFTTDILASGVETVPATILDRVGTDHLSRVGSFLSVATQGLATGLADFNGSTVFISTATGGIAGINTGFWIQCLMWIPSSLTLTDVSRYVLCRGNTTNAGYELRISSGGPSFQCVFANGVGGRISAQVNITPAMKDRMLLVVAQHTGAGNTGELYVMDASTMASVAVSGFTPLSGPMSFGGYQTVGSFPASGLQLFGCGGGHAVLTGGEITQLFADTYSTNDLVSVAGKTSHRFSLKSDIADVAGGVPSLLRERNSGTDNLVRIGSPLMLAQRTDRVWGHEISPIMQAAQPSSTGASRWETTAGAATGGGGTGFFVGLMLRSRAAVTGRVVTHANGSTLGWGWNGVSGASLVFSAADASGTGRNAPTIAFGVDSKIRCVAGVVDAPNSLIRAYYNRAQVSTGSACTGYLTTGLSALGLTVGSFYGGGSPTDSWDVLGLVIGNSVPTLAEFMEWEDACMALEDIVALGGLRTEHMYSAKRGRSGLTMLDLVGSAHLLAVGTPTFNDIYTRSFGR